MMEEDANVTSATSNSTSNAPALPSLKRRLIPLLVMVGLVFSLEFNHGALSSMTVGRNVASIRKASLADINASNTSSSTSTTTNTATNTSVHNMDAPNVDVNENSPITDGDENVPPITITSTSTAVSQLEQSTLEASLNESLLLIPQQEQPEEEPEIGFVHIGKAGGESIKSILKSGCHSYANRMRRNHCFQHLPVSRLSNHSMQYTHCLTKTTGVPGYAPKESHPNTFLFNMRHPVDRMVSWYKYIHPAFCDKKRDRNTMNCAAAHEVYVEPNGYTDTFFHCFPALQDWVGILHNSNHTNNVTEECKILGYETMLGLRSDAIATHTKANYWANMNQTIFSTYAQAQPKPPQILLVRTNTMWEDLKAIDLYLGGTGSFGGLEGKKVTHGSEKRTASDIAKPLDTDSYRSFCCALRDEMIAAVHLVQQAANLDPTDKIATVNDLVQRCGAESYQDYLHNICPIQAISSNTTVTASERL